MSEFVLVWSETDKSFWVIPEEGVRSIGKLREEFEGDLKKMVWYKTPGATMVTRLWNDHLDKRTDPVMETCEPLGYARELYLILS